MHPARVSAPLNVAFTEKDSSRSSAEHMPSTLLTSATCHGNYAAYNQIL
jgi:hypothetical protein